VKKKNNYEMSHKNFRAISINCNENLYGEFPVCRQAGMWQKNNKINT